MKEPELGLNLRHSDTETRTETGLQTRDQSLDIFLTQMTLVSSKESTEEGKTGEEASLDASGRRGTVVLVGRLSGRRVERVGGVSRAGRSGCGGNSPTARAVNTRITTRGH